MGMGTRYVIAPDARRWMLIEYLRAEKSILGGIYRAGIGGGFRAAIAVERDRHDTDRVCELVGGVPQRLVLSVVEAHHICGRLLPYA
jgi:hypothetical protein